VYEWFRTITKALQMTANRRGGAPAKEGQASAELPLPTLTAFKAGDPVRALYNDCLQKAQGGSHDNLLKQLRYYVLHQLVVEAARKFPALSIAECGCWWGHSTRIIAALLKAQDGFCGRLHVFDSFEGLSEFKAQDQSTFRPTPAQEERARSFFRSDLARVSEGLSAYPFVTFHPGWIPTKFREVEGETFSLVTVDVDLYEPTRDAVEFFYSRLNKGGIMYFDDYGYETFPGAKLAVDQHRRTVAPELFVALPFGSAFLVK
jgi:hypothetical protein